jgi:hypothetical protein
MAGFRFSGFHKNRNPENLPDDFLHHFGHTQINCPFRSDPAEMTRIFEKAAEPLKTGDSHGLRNPVLPCESVWQVFSVFCVFLYLL